MDLVDEMLEQAGYDYGYFSCGGSSIGLRKSAGKAQRRTNDPHFTLDIRSPRETASGGTTYASLRVMDKALSSSGDYESNYEIDGQVYCHIVSPFTGYPVNVNPDGAQSGICTVTLLSGSATEDDALTTALCLMGPQTAIDYINESLSHRDVVLVFFKQGEARYEVVTNMEAITLTDPAFELASRTGEQGGIVYTGNLISMKTEDAGK